MKKKYCSRILSAVFAFALFTGCGEISLSTGGSSTLVTTEKNTEAYINYNDYDRHGVVDGFCYQTEQGLTRTFISYVNGNGNVWLCDPSDNYFSEYDPKDKCRIEPGKAYTITYDVQHITGGEAGVRESYFLKVDSCEKTEVSKLFAQGVTNLNIWDCRHIAPAGYGRVGYAASAMSGNRFILVYDGKHYVVFKEDGSILHFDEIKQVMIPFETAEKKDSAPIGFCVLCDQNVSEERVINGLKSGTLANDRDIFLLGSCNAWGENPTEYADEAAGVNATNIKCFKLETPAEPGFRKVITNEQFEQGITAEEMGLSESVYTQAMYMWKDEKEDALRAGNGKKHSPYSRGILILSGEFTVKDTLFMDDNARFILAADDQSAKRDGDTVFNYAMISVRSEYLSLLSQD